MVEDLAPKETNSLAKVAVNNWVVVKFPNPKVKTMKFLGKIIGVRKGRFLVVYVQPKATRYDYSGYAYSYPPRKDKSLIKFDQIVKKVEDPVEWRCGCLKFDLHCNSF